MSAQAFGFPNKKYDIVANLTHDLIILVDCDTFEIQSAEQCCLRIYVAKTNPKSVIAPWDCPRPRRGSYNSRTNCRRDLASYSDQHSNGLIRLAGLE